MTLISWLEAKMSTNVVSEVVSDLIRGSKAHEDMYLSIFMTILMMMSKMSTIK